MYNRRQIQIVRSVGLLRFQVRFSVNGAIGREIVWKRYGSVLGEPDTSHNVNGLFICY
jgi:hypothetical protein